MISRFKFKIILGYTGLLFAIIIAILTIISSLLSFQLRQEIDHNLEEKARVVESWIRDDGVVPECGRDFFKTIFENKRIDFFDVINITDRADDKYLLAIGCSENIFYVTEKYINLRTEIDSLAPENMKIETVKLNGLPFSLIALNKPGYSIYIGYELSTITMLRQRIIKIFLTTFPFVVLISIIFVYLFTQKFMSTVDVITATTAGITSKNLTERIPVPPGKDEITNLIVTINAMIDRLEKSFIMIRQFSQDAAHELRTPLTIIRGEIENMMMQKKLSRNNALSFESVLEEIHYLSSIVNKLLLLHSLDTNEDKFSFRRVDISGIVTDMADDARLLAIKKNIAVNFKCDKQLIINGNEDLLGQMIWNLIDNAVKYTGKNGEISINMSASDGKVMVSVKDNGPGIPEDELPKIFTRFYRVEQSHSREIAGSGLGLAISKWVAELHSGEIKVASTPGEGSEFTIILPA
jgi:signal transduction histidine kinase